MKKTLLRVLSLLFVLCTVFIVTVLPVSAASGLTYGNKVKIVDYNAVTGGTIKQRYATFYLKGALWSKNVKIVSLYTDGQSGSTITSKATFDVKVHDSNGKLIKEYRNLKCGSTFSIPGGFKTSTVYVCSKFPGYNIHSHVYNAAAMYGAYTLK